MSNHQEIVKALAVCLVYSALCWPISLFAATELEREICTSGKSSFKASESYPKYVEGNAWLKAKGNEVTPVANNIDQISSLMMALIEGDISQSEFEEQRDQLNAAMNKEAEQIKATSKPQQCRAIGGQLTQLWCYAHWDKVTNEPALVSESGAKKMYADLLEPPLSASSKTMYQFAIDSIDLIWSGAALSSVISDKYYDCLDINNKVFNPDALFLESGDIEYIQSGAGAAQ